MLIRALTRRGYSMRLLCHAGENGLELLVVERRRVTVKADVALRINQHAAGLRANGERGRQFAVRVASRGELRLWAVGLRHVTLGIGGDAEDQEIAGVGFVPAIHLWQHCA